MKTTGIIAEFNPFHNGHAYLLQKARELTGAEVVVVVMSGSFVQRGTPALLSKYTRAEMALRCGADLVIELPVFSACASAEYFAEGAVRLLHDLQLDSFCFGSESGDLNALLPAARLLAEEPPEYRSLLKQQLSAGSSFPAARQAALSALLPSMASVLSAPNNLLGIEYLKACCRHRFRLQPITILRAGSSYHEQNLISSDYPSASALRRLFDGSALPLSLTELSSYMPEAAYPLLEQEFFRTFPVTENDYSSLLSYRLLHTSASELAAYADMGTELANRIYSRRFDCIQTRAFTESLKTKELTYTRISRALLHTILQISAWEQECFRQLPATPYARILGLTSAARPFLKQLNPLVPLIQKPARAKKMLSEEAYAFFEKDLLASELYRQLSYQRFQTPQPSEMAHEIIFLE